MLKNVLIVVDDIEKSIEFYRDLFGLQVILKNEGNVILSEGLVLQDADIWGKTLNETSTPFNNMMELYFEDFDIDGLLAKYESGKYSVRYATGLTELAGGQKLVRLYDPSGNLIEVRTPFRWHIGRNTYQIHISQAIHLYQNPRNTIPSCYCITGLWSGGNGIRKRCLCDSSVWEMVYQ